MKEVLSSLTTYHTKTKIFCWNKNFPRRPPPNSKTLLAVSSIGESGEWGRLRTARAAISLRRCKNQFVKTWCCRDAGSEVACGYKLLILQVIGGGMIDCKTLPNSRHAVSLQ